MRRLATLMLLPALFASVLFVAAAPAVQPDEILVDPALETRARAISKDLRCVVCQNQSIDDSNAGIARDLRLLVRERLVAGDTDAEVVAFIVGRYGDYVLLDPPFKPATWALWVGPPIMIGTIVMLIVMWTRRWKLQQEAREDIESLSPRDRAELDALVDRLAETAPPPPKMSAYRAELNEPRTPLKSAAEAAPEGIGGEENADRALPGDPIPDNSGKPVT